MTALRASMAARNRRFVESGNRVFDIADGDSEQTQRCHIRTHPKVVWHRHLAGVFMSEMSALQRLLGIGFYIRPRYNALGPTRFYPEESK